MKKRHKVAIGAFTTLTIIFIILTVFVIKGTIIKQNAENTKLEEELKLLQIETNKQINELVDDLINTKTYISGKFISIDEDIYITKEKVVELSAQTNKDFSDIIKKSIKSVVTVRTLNMQGSGFFINTNGYIVTNTHILLDEFEELQSLIQVVTSDNQIYSAIIIGTINEIDLTLLKINSEYPKLELANSNNIEKGENVIAIGSPEGLALSITDGIVSATKRIGSNNKSYYVQTNAELNQGNSGGPLINKKGQVIGMNNFKIMDTEGLGFALESNYVKEGVNQIGQEALNKTIIE